MLQWLKRIYSAASAGTFINPASSVVSGYNFPNIWQRFQMPAITPEHGKPSHGRSLPFLRWGVGHVFRLALHGRGGLAISPLHSGMTVVDRPTISGQFLGRFRAHSLPNKRRMPVSTVTSREPKRRLLGPKSQKNN
jgi:hypothetical protein